MAVERIAGLRQARFSWQDARGVVTYDSTRISIGAVIEALNRMTGYEARVEDAEG